MQRTVHSFGAVCSIIVTDDGLCRLCYGIADGEHHRKEIAGDGKSCYPFFSEQGDEHIVAGNHHDSHCHFGQESSESYFYHISCIAQSE